MENTTFQDIFKSSFIERLSQVSILDMAIAVALSLLLGIFIFFIYRRTYRGVMYSPSFGISLVAIAMITAILILAVTSNVVLSLGMVGALSIVRFRAAIKEPMDIVFLFWSLAVGIILASGLIPLAVLGSLAIGCVLLVMSKRPSGDRPYILVVHCASPELEASVAGIVEASVRRWSLKSKSIEPGKLELDYEVRLIDSGSGFVEAISALEGVEYVTLVSYNGDYTG